MAKIFVAVLPPLIAVAVAVAAVASAQDPLPVVDLSANITPTKAGTTDRPESANVRLTVLNGGESHTTVSRIQFEVEETVKLSTAGLPTCTVSGLNTHQDSKQCPKGSRIGSGSALAFVGETRFTFAISTFAAGPGEIAVFLVPSAGFPGPLAVPGAISGGTVTVELPPPLQQPVPDLYIELNELDVTFGKSAASTIGCTGGSHTASATLAYAPNPGPAPAPATDMTTTACQN